jgi:hypothetical protein
LAGKLIYQVKGLECMPKKKVKFKRVKRVKKKPGAAIVFVSARWKAYFYLPHLTCP